ncbi:hypothetical protein NDU88_001008 [Pleurodeles waltl]|uniref:Uncharacterized protein n=1 Tax=Pleurodeles waltl TaxID=8319 RepID=A0AAV7NC85_PLEWA|nr:hypothetical protein NDU88_001008 [Pleurodeles waltl]
MRHHSNAAPRLRPSREAFRSPASLCGVPRAGSNERRTVPSAIAPGCLVSLQSPALTRASPRSRNTLLHAAFHLVNRSGNGNPYVDALSEMGYGSLIELLIFD